MNQDKPPGSCERSLLLLSLAADSSVTVAQRAELDAHLPRCADCRRAAAADTAVRARLVERASAPSPSWLAGFAGRTAGRAAAQFREARSQNHLLWMSAAAALLVAVCAQLALPRGGPAGGTPLSAVSSVRDTASQAVFRPPLVSIEGR